MLAEGSWPKLKGVGGGRLQGAAARGGGGREIFTRPLVRVPGILASVRENVLWMVRSVYSFFFVGTARAESRKIQKRVLRVTVSKPKKVLRNLWNRTGPLISRPLDQFSCSFFCVFRNFFIFFLPYLKTYFVVFYCCLLALFFFSSIVIALYISLSLVLLVLLLLLSRCAK